MALMYAEYPEPEPIERAVQLVMSRQLPVSNSSFSAAWHNVNHDGVGWVLGTGSDRGRVQQDVRYRVPELQIFFHHLDAGSGSSLSSKAAREENREK